MAAFDNQFVAGQPLAVQPVFQVLGDDDQPRANKEVVAFSVGPLSQLAASVTPLTADLFNALDPDKLAALSGQGVRAARALAAHLSVCSLCRNVVSHSQWC